MNRFRWVQCQIESLIIQKTPLAIESALERVSETLSKLTATFWPGYLLRIENWLKKYYFG